MEIRFADEVYTDLLSSMDWFDARRVGLGDELESEFYAAVARIKEAPLQFAADESGYRPCRLQRFSAVAYFRIETDFILIVGLLVHGRDDSQLKGL